MLLLAILFWWNVTGSFIFYHFYNFISIICSSVVSLAPHFLLPFFLQAVKSIFDYLNLACSHLHFLFTVDGTDSVSGVQALSFPFWASDPAQDLTHVRQALHLIIPLLSPGCDVPSRPIVFCILTKHGAFSVLPCVLNLCLWGNWFFEQLYSTANSQMSLLFDGL